MSRSFTIPVSRATQSAEDPDDSDDEDADDNETAVMIPMADMLNAAYERDNARLYDDEAENMNTVQEKLSAVPGYTMVSTQRISCGQQIVSLYYMFAHRSSTHTRRRPTLNFFASTATSTPSRSPRRR